MIPRSRSLLAVMVGITLLQAGVVIPTVILLSLYTFLFGVTYEARAHGPFWPVWVGVGCQLVALLFLRRTEAERARHALVRALILHALGLAIYPGALFLYWAAPSLFSETASHVAFPTMPIGLVYAMGCAVTCHLLAQGPILTYLARLADASGTEKDLGPRARLFRVFWTLAVAAAAGCVSLLFLGQRWAGIALLIAGPVLGVALLAYVGLLERCRKAVQRARWEERQRPTPAVPGGP
jgi:hypothetical protein